MAVFPFNEAQDDASSNGHPDEGGYVLGKRSQVHGAVSNGVHWKPASMGS